MTATESIACLLDPARCSDARVYDAFQERLKHGAPSRDENGVTHFGVMILPWNPATKQLFIGHHKKSGRWIPPGGHMDKGETPHQAVNREIEEELGIKNFFQEAPSPCLLTRMDIQNAVPTTCREHFDLWFLMETDGKKIKTDHDEFYETRWVTLPEARALVSDPATPEALDYLETLPSPYAPHT